jgi:hypothetical protein
MTSHDSSAVGESPADDVSRALFEQFSQRLIGLARCHLDSRLKHKVDPEDVVQSAYKSFFLRYGDQKLAAQGSDAIFRDDKIHIAARGYHACPGPELRHDTRLSFALCR